MKQCTDCKKMKELEEFAFRSKIKGTRHITCKECQKDKSRKHYLGDSASYKLRAKKRRVLYKEWFRKFKESLQCEQCGENHPATLHFHHNESEDKDDTISEAIRRGWSKKRLMLEIEKCTVLCSNCHAIHHWNERNASISAQASNLLKR